MSTVAFFLSQTDPRVNLHDRHNPQTLRPHVSAIDRFLHWLTPYGLDRIDELAQTFPIQHILRLRFVLANSASPDALASYSAGLEQFSSFCDDFKIPETDRMPASATLLSVFVANRGVGSVDNESIQAWLGGLELWHHINLAPWLGGSLRL
jgi:hypothetical protein